MKARPTRRAAASGGRAELVVDLAPSPDRSRIDPPQASRCREHLEPGRPHASMANDPVVWHPPDGMAWDRLRRDDRARLMVRSQRQRRRAGSRRSPRCTGTPERSAWAGSWVGPGGEELKESADVRNVTAFRV